MGLFNNPAAKRRARSLFSGNRNVVVDADMIFPLINHIMISKYNNITILNTKEEFWRFYKEGVTHEH